MTAHIEYLVAGGPRHGVVISLSADDAARLRIDSPRPDNSYRVAACRRAPESGLTRFVLLHPLATGAQFLAMLALAARIGRDHVH
jgi:hypothetical protein